LLLALTAEKFACRPSDLVRLEDGVLALDFDLAAAARLLERERAAWAEIPEESLDTGPALPRRARELRW
jgi:hypothetical protein